MRLTVIRPFSYMINNQWFGLMHMNCMQVNVKQRQFMQFFLACLLMLTSAFCAADNKNIATIINNKDYID